MSRASRLHASSRALLDFSISRWSRSSLLSTRSHNDAHFRFTNGLISQRTRNFSRGHVWKQDTPDVILHSVSQSIQSGPLDSNPAIDSRRQQAARRLPVLCPGCGAPSQTVDKDAPGHFNLSAGRNLRFSQAESQRKSFKSDRREEENEIYKQALERLNGSFPLSQPTEQPPAASPQNPICDRCHMLRYQSQGHSIIHPSLESIQAMIEESPHKYNHIYHVIDAADFPMSLVPDLTNALRLPRLRTQNRRSKTIRFLRGRTAEVSFIITRSDLLAPKKEQVDALVPYLKEVLRDALGRSQKNVRLGNVRCVSAKRGWWTRTVKEEIWTRGGAGWMVGKVNVGKSALYEVVFPKGRNHESDTNPDRIRANIASTSNPDEGAEVPYQEMLVEGTNGLADGPEEDTLFDEASASILPPPRQETAYPDMPTVSNLPGTTASPIRIPYGNGKGELIDLPGIHRSSLDTHVKQECQMRMIMKDRAVPESLSIKPGQSLLLGGIIRITPKLKADEDLVFMAYPFLPTILTPHVTSTPKAVAIQTGRYDHSGGDASGEEYTGTVQSIATPEAKALVRSAGTFSLSWDVTKKSAGPLTAKHAVGLKSDRLPFIVYSADILIEGVGWVELACQMRRRRQADALSPFAPVISEPAVEIFSPEGKFVGVRRPMNAFLLGGPKKVPVHKRRGRPRQTISMQRRREGSQKAQKRGSS